MSTDDTITISAEETTRRKQEQALLEQLRENRKRRPRAEVRPCKDDDGDDVFELVCPFCGGADDFQYVEAISNTRSVNGVGIGIDDAPYLGIDGYYETTGEDGDDERLYCCGCNEECNLPAIDIDWE